MSSGRLPSILQLVSLDPFSNEEMQLIPACTFPVTCQYILSPLNLSFSSFCIKYQGFVFGGFVERALDSEIMFNAYSENNTNK